MATSTTQGFPTQGSGLADQGKTMASQAADQAQSAATFVADQANAGLHAVGAGMESVGQAVRDYAPRAMGDATASIADRLESGGRYLEQKGMNGIGDDLTDMIRANPVPALLVGIGLGFCLARLLRS